MKVGSTGNNGILNADFYADLTENGNGLKENLVIAR
jgi:hypothetical protein